MPGTTDSHQVIRLAGQSQALMGELADALKAAGATLEEVVWIGYRLGHHFEHLAGVRVLPYWTKIGDRWIRIDGDRHFFNGEGEETEDDFANVRYVAEQNPTWIWSDTEPTL